MASHNDLGKRGEELAKEYLENKGYQILKMNWRHKRAEIDLIAKQKDTLVFIEVKTRSSTNFGQPEEFVDWKKEKQFEFASLFFIEQSNHEGEIRFDIIAITFENKNNYIVNHIEDAFWPS
ncbi:YraN family protein [Pedobacter sp. JCM 36344]|uniref:YraN family protein n=1 Tax=Pedobacter sp. JCM 36344 TaxID=3374280 RepID=UPI0039799D18